MKAFLTGSVLSASLLAAAQTPAPHRSSPAKPGASHAAVAAPQPSLLIPASLHATAPAVFKARFTTTAGDFVVKVASGGGESGFEDGGSRGVERGGNEQRGLGRGDCGVRGAGFGRRAAVGSGSLGGGEQARAQDASGKEGFHDDRLY